MTHFLIWKRFGNSIFRIIIQIFQLWLIWKSIFQIFLIAISISLVQRLAKIGKINFFQFSKFNIFQIFYFPDFLGNVFQIDPKVEKLKNRNLNLKKKDGVFPNPWKNRNLKNCIKLFFSFWCFPIFAIWKRFFARFPFSPKKRKK